MPKYSLSEDEAKVLAWYREARSHAANRHYGGAGQVRVLLVGDSQFVPELDRQLDYIGGGLCSFENGAIVAEAEHSECNFPDEPARPADSKLCVIANGLVFHR